MNDIEFDQVLRAALKDALLEDYQEAIQNADKLDIHFSKEYIRRREKMLPDPFGYAKKASRGIWQRIAHFAAMFLLAVSVLFGALMTIPEARAAIIEFYQEWREDHMDFHFQGGISAEDRADTLMRNYHLALLDSEFLPEGFTDISKQYATEIEITDESGQAETILCRDMVVFENEEGELIWANYVSHSNGDIELAVNTENVSAYERELDGITYYVFEYLDTDDVHILVWNDDALQVHYTLSFPSSYTIDTVLAFAKHICLVENN